MYVYTCINPFTSNGRLDESVTIGSGETVNFVVNPKAERTREDQ